MASDGFGARRMEFSVGDTLQATWDSLSKNFPVMAALALVLVGVPRLLLGLFSSPAAMFYSRATAFGPSGALPSFRAGLVGLLIFVVCGVLLQAAVTHASVLYLTGRRADLAGCLRSALRILAPLVGIAVLTWVCLFLGTLCFIVPGLILGVMWSVAVPAEVMEKVGVLGALARSRDLTRSRRWPVFGFFVVLAILNFIILIVAGMVTASLTLGVGGLYPGTVGYLPVALVNALVSSFTAVVNASATAALYVSLRRLKDGATPDSLASVFD